MALLGPPEDRSVALVRGAHDVGRQPVAVARNEHEGHPQRLGVHGRVEPDSCSLRPAADGIPFSSSSRTACVEVPRSPAR